MLMTVVGENNPFFNISSGKLLNNNSFIKNYWSSAYKRIGLCNRFLEGIANAPESEQKTRMVAEARFCVPLSITIWPVILRMYL